MKLDEILAPDKKRQQELAATMLQSMYSKRPPRAPDPEADARRNAYRDQRKAIETQVQQIAVNSSDFSTFEQQAMNQIPNVTKYINLKWAYDTYSSAGRSDHQASLSDYAKERQSSFGVKYTGD